ALARGVGAATVVAGVGTLVAAIRPAVGRRTVARIRTACGAAILRRSRRAAGLVAARAARLLAVGALIGAIRPIGTLLPIGTVGPLLTVGPIRAFRAVGPIRAALRAALLRLRPLALLGFGTFAGGRRALARLLPLGPLLPGLGTFLPGLGPLAGLGAGRRALLPRLGPLLPGFRPLLSRLGALARLRPLRRTSLRARAPALAARAAWPTLAGTTRTTGSAAGSAPLSRPALGQPDHVVAPRRHLAREKGLEQQRRQDRAGQQQRAGRAHQEKPLVRRRSLRTP
ncbi:hypothetical protein, partial [Methylobacterium ajmalii]|uniref:hypothetical protein n=1 Tax=Methylobacterium ajmalii TaxID=2738439 RepID=UPI003B969280|nr:hypothetical protein [Methylobacterium ajmalii]